MKIKLLTAAALTLAAVGAAQAQDVISVANNPWEGFFAGANIGGAWNHTCQSWEPGAAITSGMYPGLANAFYNRNCPNNGNFIGGVDFGYNFQIDQWVWGFKADYDAVGNKSYNRSYTYTGDTGAGIPSLTAPMPSTARSARTASAFWVRGSATRSINGCRTFGSVRPSPADSIRRRSVSLRRCDGSSDSSGQHQRRQELQVQWLQCRRRS